MEIIMRDRFSGSVVTFAIVAAAVGATISVPGTGASAQTRAQASAAGTSLKTPWGEPDLQGIWTDEFDTPFQRSPKYANQEFFTEAQRKELDSGESITLTTRVRRAGLRPTSAAPIIRSS
jgi:hypothetical protein